MEWTESSNSVAFLVVLNSAIEFCFDVYITNSKNSKHDEASLDKLIKYSNKFQS